MKVNLDIYLNQIGQKIIDLKEASSWFEKLMFDDQLEVLRRYTFFVSQMGGVGSDAQKAIEMSKLKKTYTSCILLKKYTREDKLGSNGLRMALFKIINLPKNENWKSFILLSFLYMVIFERKYENNLSPEAIGGIET